MSAGNDRACFDHWQKLDTLLSQHLDYWQPEPFIEPSPAWITKAPALAAEVHQLTPAACEVFESNPDALIRHLTPFLPALKLLRQYQQQASLPVQPCPLPEKHARDMPGRKREQAGHFVGALLPLQSPVLDWCCGKGHLARTLSPWHDETIQGFEWNPQLVAAGNQLAMRERDSVRLLQQDVLDPQLRLPEGVHMVALHACGDLHRVFLQRGVAARQPRLSLSPCCYHLTQAQVYQPLSARILAQPQRTQLSRDLLRMAVRETATSAPRIRRRQLDAQCWRLAFDGLQRHLRGLDAYWPVPTHPVTLMQGDFAGFCCWAAAQSGLQLPQSVDFSAWLAWGRVRLLQVRQHELVRHLFRRAIEIWLVLDQVLYLQEQGYQVRFGVFCPRALTPRNLLLDAQLKSFGAN